MTAARVGNRASALVRACHPLPTIAVTVFATSLAIKAGNSPATCAVLAAAVLFGQLSIGWSNDRIDAERDRLVGRADKPVASGEVLLRTIDRALAVVVAGAVIASLALGWRAGALHLAAVSCGWLYNAGVKSTVWSPLPYLAAFGALPAIATLALSPPQLPMAWAVIASALLGAAAHFANTLPDLDGDKQTGVAGLPQRLGARPTIACTGLLLVAGTAAAALGPGPSPARLTALAAAVILTVLGVAAAWRRPPGRWIFGGVIALAALNVALMLTGPGIVH